MKRKIEWWWIIKHVLLAPAWLFALLLLIFLIEGACLELHIDLPLGASPIIAMLVLYGLLLVKYEEYKEKDK